MLKNATTILPEITFQEECMNLHSIQMVQLFLCCTAGRSGTQIYLNEMNSMYMKSRRSHVFFLNFEIVDVLHFIFAELQGQMEQVENTHL